MVNTAFSVLAVHHNQPSFVFVSRDCWECPYLPRWEGSEHPSWRRPSWPRRCPTPTARPPPWPCTPPSACKYFPCFYLDYDDANLAVPRPYIVHYGTAEQQERYLPAMTAGECVASVGMTEPDAGSDLQGMRTTAKRDGDDWIINGSKIYITNGWLTDCCIVCAKTKPDAKRAAHGISLFLVDADTKGFHKGRKLKKLGLKAQDTAELFFEDVRVPGSALLGKENGGFYQLMEQLPQERLVIAVHSAAHCEAMFEETRDWVRQRKAFGRTVADLQTVQHKLAELKTSIAVCRAFIDQCLELHTNHKLDGSMASMAKYWATDLENKVAADCLQLHGGWGFMWETQIAKSYADSRVQTIYGGTNEIMKELIARDIVKPQ